MSRFNPPVSAAIISGIDAVVPPYIDTSWAYNEFKGTALEFLVLKGVDPRLKLWAMCHLLPSELLEVFAVDCLFALSAPAGPCIDLYGAEENVTLATAKHSAKVTSRQTYNTFLKTALTQILSVESAAFQGYNEHLAIFAYLIEEFSKEEKAK